jgi:serine/threonine protein kinase
MANVLPANAAQAFLEALATSQILNAEAVAKIRDQFAAADDPKIVARDLIKEGKITKWQAIQLLNKFTKLIVGNYKLLDQLGVGELGRVYLAEHVQMQRKVALKDLARRYTSQPQNLRRILAEARRVASLEHPNISHIQDVNQDGERYFIVLEYFDALDLQRQVQNSGKLSAATAWNVIRQAAEGLAHAHSKGIMHGGLKPSNLLLDKQGAVKILDFGLGHLASGVDGDSSDSVDQAAITGKLYRAPEVGKGSVDRAADVYSLGATLFFLLTGKAPAEGPASAGQLAALAGDAPKDMVQLCTKLMSAKPTDRPADDQALIAEIDAAKPGQVPTSPTKSAPKATASPAAKTPAPTKAAALPTAKPMATAGAEEPAAKAAPPRAKKPLTAKALPSASDSQAVPVAAAETPAAPISETPAPAADDDNPFAGFALQTKGKKAGATSGAMPAIAAAPPAAKAPAAKAPPPKAAPPKEAVAKEASADSAADQPVPAKGKKTKGKAAAGSNLPLILAGGIGGGVLVLGAIIGLVMFLMNGDDSKEVAKVDGEQQTATEQNTTPAGEANPAEANPAEANPVIPAEANPVTPPVAPMPAPMPAGETPKPEVTPEPVKPDPAKPDPPMIATVTPEVKPEPKPEVKPEPKPVPKPEPKPMPVGDPFVGFPKAVSLPKLPAGMSEPTPEMLAAMVLGPCKVPDENTVISAVMKGGGTAYSKGKMTFTMESGNGGTSLRDWDIKLAGGLIEKPVVVATLSAKNNQLLFQWTAEAAKQAAAPYLCNCMITLNAGAGKAEFALREPVPAEPIVIGIEKRSPMAKFNIDLPPEPKQLMVEIISVEGEIPKIKFDNKDLVAEKDTTYFWVGNVETEMPLAIKVDTSITNSGRTVQVATMPHFKIEPLTRPVIFGKKELGNFEGQIKGALQQGQMMIQAAGQTKDAKAKEKLNHDASLALEPAQKAQASFDQMIALAKGLDKGRIRFRIYASAEDGKVELLNGSGDAGAAIEQPAAGGNDKKKP